MSKLNNYAVHLFVPVRVKVGGVKAINMVQAMEIAGDAVDFHELLDNHKSRCAVKGEMLVEHVEYPEERPSYALIDPILEDGEVDYENATWLAADGTLLVNGQTVEERKALASDQARLFMQELLDSVETLTGIADEHGVRTLADLMYLQNSILSGGFIDHYPGESKVLEIASDLPSGEQWTKFIKVEYMDSPTP